MIKTDKPTFRSSDPMRTKIILNKVGQQRYKKKKYKRGPNAWSLGPTERSSSEYGAYVHNSVKNFAKQIRLNDIDKSLLKGLSTVEAQLKPSIDAMMDQVKPTQEMYQNEDVIFGIIGNGYYGNLLDSIKDRVSLLYSHPLVRAMSKIKVGYKKDTAPDVYPLIDRTTGTVNKTTNNRKTAIQAFTDYLGLQLGFTKQTVSSSKGKKYDYTIIEEHLLKILEISSEELIDIINKGLFTGSNSMYEDRLYEIVAKGTGFSIQDIKSLPRIFSDLKIIFNQINKQASKIKDLKDVSTINFFKKIDRIEDLMKYYTTFMKKSGLLYEMAKALDIYRTNQVTDVVHLGQSDIKDFNTSDLDFVMTSIPSIKERIGVTIKQTTNFKKIDTKLYLTGNTASGQSKRYGLTDKGIGHKFVDNYKYFMLNYSILSNIDASGWSAHTLYKDAPIMSIGEIHDTVMLLNNVIGKLILTQALLGPIFFKRATNEELNFQNNFTGTNAGLPYVLSTQDGCFWTWDILNDLQALLLDGTVSIDFYIHDLGLHNGLVKAKRALFGYDMQGKVLKDFDVNSDVPQSYREVLTPEVRGQLKKINDSVFHTTNNGAMYVPMNTSIVLTAIQERINSARRLRRRKI